jgi:hypothetical protein
VRDFHGRLPGQRCEVKLHPLFAHDPLGDEFRIGVADRGQNVRFQQREDFDDFDVREQRRLELSLSLKGYILRTKKGE